MNQGTMDQGTMNHCTMNLSSTTPNSRALTSVTTPHHRAHTTSLSMCSVEEIHGLNMKPIKFQIKRLSILMLIFTVPMVCLSKIQMMSRFCRPMLEIKNKLTTSPICRSLILSLPRMSLVAPLSLTSPSRTPPSILTSTHQPRTIWSWLTPTMQRISKTSTTYLQTAN